MTACSSSNPSVWQILTFLFYFTGDTSFQDEAEVCPKEFFSGDDDEEEGNGNGGRASSRKKEKENQEIASPGFCTSSVLNMTCKPQFPGWTFQ